MSSPIYNTHIPLNITFTSAKLMDAWIRMEKMRYISNMSVDTGRFFLVSPKRIVEVSVPIITGAVEVSVYWRLLVKREPLVIKLTCPRLPVVLSGQNGLNSVTSAPVINATSVGDFMMNYTWNRKPVHNGHCNLLRSDLSQKSIKKLIKKIYEYSPCGYY